MVFSRGNWRRSAGVGLLAMSLLTAGCSNGGDSGNKAGGDGGKASEDGAGACTLVTRAEVQSGLGVTLSDDGKSSDVGPASNCDWNAAGQFVRLSVVRANSAGEAAQSFDVLDDRPGAQLLPDLGDKAVFLGVAETKNAQLFILEGDRMVTLSYCCASQEQLVDIGRTALNRLD